MHANTLPEPLNPSPKPRPPTSRRRKVAIGAAVTLVVALLVFLNYYFSNLYRELYVLTRDLIQQNSVATFFVLTGLNVAFQMLFIPGISLFILFIGFVTHSYLKTMLIVYPSTILIAALSYYIARYTIRGWLHAKLNHKWYYKLYSEKCREAPLKTSWMLRVLLIPITYKNYLIAILDMDFRSFMIPAVVHYFLYFSCYAIIGASISTIDDAINGKVPTENRAAYFLFLGFVLAMMVASVAVIVYFTVMTVKKFREHKRESIERSIVSDDVRELVKEEKL